MDQGGFSEIPCISSENAKGLIGSAWTKLRKVRDETDQIQRIIDQNREGLKIKCISSEMMIEKIKFAKEEVQANFIKEMRDWKKEIDVDHVESITVSGAAFAFTGLLGWELIEKLYLDEHYGSLKFNRWNCGSRLKEYTEELGGEILDNVEQ